MAGLTFMISNMTDSASLRDSTLVFRRGCSQQSLPAVVQELRAVVQDLRTRLNDSERRESALETRVGELEQENSKILKAGRAQEDFAEPPTPPLPARVPADRGP